MLFAWNHKMLTVNEFSLALRELNTPDGPRQVTVPMVEFVYLCPDMYKVVRSSYKKVFEFMQVPNDVNVNPLLKVFGLLDFVVPPEDFALAELHENLACAAFSAWDNVEVLEFLWHKGFSWDKQTLVTAVKYKSWKCHQFITSKIASY